MVLEAFRFSEDSIVRALLPLQSGHAVALLVWLKHVESLITTAGSGRVWEATAETQTPSDGNRALLAHTVRDLHLVEGLLFALTGREKNKCCSCRSTA